MENLFKNNQLNIDELDKCEKNIIDIDLIKKNILNCFDDRDPISMNIFWKETNNIKYVEYPEKYFQELVFYTDEKKLLRCLEKETLQYLKAYDLMVHPITYDPIPIKLFENLELIDMNKIKESNLIEDIALEVFQDFSKISIFIDHKWFMELNKDKLLKFNYELSDFWLQNLTPDQKKCVHEKQILLKKNNELVNKEIEEIQKYLLEEIKIMLSCDKDDIKYMVNYIVLGALSIVIPKIKELYSDFSFAFNL
jgi:hypothetical protein